jgi:hypothetical protein
MSTDELLRSLILLGATALVTGVGVPIVLRHVDEGRAARAKDKDARLARQQKVIEAQSKLLDDLSSLLWRWRYLSMRVAYYGLLGGGERYERAQQEYDTEVWGVFDSVRVEISRARRLASQRAYEILLRFYEDQLVELDKDLMNARDTAAADRRALYFELNKRIYGETSARIDTVLHDLAHQLGLSETDVTEADGSHGENRTAA